jgi:citrate synthase
MIVPFWRAELFSDTEQQLIDALLRAHHESCFRNNPSTVTVTNAAAGSGCLSKAIAAGILCIGSRHAPLSQTVEFLDQPYPSTFVPIILGRGEKVPGWGGTFQRGEPDPIWIEMDSLLHKFRPDIAQKLDSVTAELAAIGKKLTPNPSAYTACVAITIGLPAHLASYLFIAGRLSAWTQIAANYLLTGW